VAKAIIALMRVKTVNLAKIATRFSGEAKVASQRHDSSDSFDYITSQKST